MLEFSEFKPVSLDDRDLFLRQYRQYPQVHSDNTFANMVCWNHYANYRFADVDGAIVLSSTIDGVASFRPPIGPKNPALLDDVIDLAAKGGERGDRSPLVGRQEEKAVVEARATARGFLLAVFVGGHGRSREVHWAGIFPRLT